MRLAAALGAFVALVAGLGVGVPLLSAKDTQTFSGTRAITYNVATSRDWPVIHQTTFNGKNVEPAPFRTDAWIDPIGFGGGLAVAGEIPNRAPDGERVDVSSTWIEWETGKVFRASLTALLPEDETVFVRFQRDGAMSLHQRGDALRAGSLGRPATLKDYKEIARVCGKPLPKASNEAQKLSRAREADQGVDVARVQSSQWPKPGRSFCSG